MSKSFLDQILPTREVLQLEGFSRTTLWRKVKAGTFPRPVKITVTTNGFFRSDLARHQAEARAAAGLPEYKESSE
jgi:predicted DNA-binding transcriptional regulator AlpA